MTKRHYKKKALPARIGETATKERRRQQGGVATEVVDRDLSGNAILKRQKAIEECTLDAYYIREVIDTPEYTAGIRFRRAYIHAVLRIRVDDYGTSYRGDIEIAMLTLMRSERLIKEAYKALSLEEQAVVISVCGHGDWAGGIRRFNSLRDGLKKLAALWKIS